MSNLDYILKKFPGLIIILVSNARMSTQLIEFRSLKVHPLAELGLELYFKHVMRSNNNLTLDPGREHHLHSKSKGNPLLIDVLVKIQAAAPYSMILDKVIFLEEPVHVKMLGLEPSSPNKGTALEEGFNKKSTMGNESNVTKNSRFV
jgi:hypothetical protein